MELGLPPRCAMFVASCYGHLFVTVYKLVLAQKSLCPSERFQ